MDECKPLPVALRHPSAPSEAAMRSTLSVSEVLSETSMPVVRGLHLSPFQLNLSRGRHKNTP